MRNQPTIRTMEADSKAIRRRPINHAISNQANIKPITLELMITNVAAQPNMLVDKKSLSLLHNAASVINETSPVNMPANRSKAIGIAKKSCWALINGSPIPNANMKDSTAPKPNEMNMRLRPSVFHRSEGPNATNAAATSGPIRLPISPYVKRRRFIEFCSSAEVYVARCLASKLTMSVYAQHKGALREAPSSS